MSIFVELGEDHNIGCVVGAGINGRPDSAFSEPFGGGAHREPDPLGYESASG